MLKTNIIDLERLQRLSTDALKYWSQAQTICFNLCIIVYDTV